MYRDLFRVPAWLLIAAISLGAYACGNKKNPELKDLPDLNEQTRLYVTTENTKVRAGPGPRFRAIADITRDAKVNVVGGDGEWVLIVSKKGNAPGFIEMASVKPAVGESKETASPGDRSKEDTKPSWILRCGAAQGLRSPVVANIGKGTKLNVVEEDKGWLKVESKRGNKPGYVEANLAKPAVEGKTRLAIF